MKKSATFRLSEDALRLLKKVAKPLLDSLKIIGDTLINSRIKANEDALRYPMQLFERYNSLQDFIRTADAKPTEQENKVFEELNARLTPELRRLQVVFDKQIPAFNDAVKQLDLKVVDPGRAIKQ